MALIQNEKIIITVFQLERMKALGLDDFLNFFFQDNWDVINEDIKKMVKDFYSTSLISPKMNKTRIILIPKIKNLENLSKYRPISCYNFIYKVISRTFTERLWK